MNNCGQCGASTVQTCNDNGCTFLENGNGEPYVPSADEIAGALEDAETMNRNMRVYGTIDAPSDLDLERRVLKACGYRVHEKERNGTRWLMACKGLQVQYKHWHPLTSIHQAMQLLIDADIELEVGSAVTYYSRATTHDGVTIGTDRDPRALIAAQCRAIVTACASLEPVR